MISGNQEGIGLTISGGPPDNASFSFPSSGSRQGCGSGAFGRAEDRTAGEIWRPEEIAGGDEMGQLFWIICGLKEPFPGVQDLGPCQSVAMSRSEALARQSARDLGSPNVAFSDWRRVHARTGDEHHGGDPTTRKYS